MSNDQLETARRLAAIDDAELRAETWRKEGAEDLGAEGFRIARVAEGSGPAATKNRMTHGDIFPL
jgi:hypothetical protein